MQRILLLDNYDSFTYNLVDYFRQLQVAVKVVRNHVTLSSIEAMQPQAIVLSPGPSTPQKAGNMLEVIEAYHTKIPLLGICLGHQGLGEFFGATLQKATKPMHGKLSTVHIPQTETGNQKSLFYQLPTQFQVVRYHSLLLTNIPPCLQITAYAETQKSQEVMAFQHHDLPVYGIQYHPEAILTDFGLQVLANFVRQLAHS
jgi:anthranilate synthase/aminodeoxychorismate synthase-like glutamine amidotransferase